MLYVEIVHLNHLRFIPQPLETCLAITIPPNHSRRMTSRTPVLLPLHDVEFVHPRLWAYERHSSSFPYPRQGEPQRYIIHRMGSPPESMNLAVTEWVRRAWIRTSRRQYGMHQTRRYPL